MENSWLLFIKCSQTLHDDLTDLSMGRWVGCTAVSPSTCCGVLNKASLYITLALTPIHNKVDREE